MDASLELRLEMAADQADRQLAQVLVQRVVEAAVLAQLLRAVGQQRANVLPLIDASVQQRSASHLRDSVPCDAQCKQMATRY